jgi:transposase
VHKESVHVCIRDGRGKNVAVTHAVFGTFTADLERLRELLRQHKVRRLVMESTGVYWMPVWNVLERGDWHFDLVLVNPQHVRALPGRKTDRLDCERLAELGQYDLLRGSFIPPREIRELRELTRRRTHLMQDRNRIVNRMARLLETANYKLGSVVSDLSGKTGWLILNALAGGETSPLKLAELAQGTLKNRQGELAGSLEGYGTDHFRWLLRQLLDDLATLDRKLNEVDQRLRLRMEPHAEAITRLCTIPGVQETTAWTLIAELGTDMSRFPDAAHAASWAGLCPGSCESAGKRQSGRTRKGDRYLRRMLIQNAWAVAHKKDCFLTALFLRVASRRGLKKAAMAVAHRVLVITWHILRDGTVYREAGGDYYDRRNPQATARRLTQRLERLGFQVTLTPSGETIAAPPPKPIRNGTTRWQLPAQRKNKRTHVSPPATVALCPRCATWGIPCIHARNAKSAANFGTHPEVTAT